LPIRSSEDGNLRSSLDYYVLVSPRIETGRLCNADNNPGMSYLGYGLSKSFAMAVFWQIFGGALSSNVALTRCIVAELNPEKRHRTRALLLLPLFANTGMLLGPLVGGLLSSNSKDLRQSRYPYLCPNIVVASVYLIGAFSIAFGVHETLESLQHVKETFAQRYRRRMREVLTYHTYMYAPLGQDDTASSTSPLAATPTTAEFSADALPKRKRRLPFRRIWTFNVVCTMISHFIINSHLGTFSSLWSVFLSMPVGQPEEQHPPLKFNGGLGMLPRDVGFAMSLLGAIGVVLQMGFYPMIQDRFGTVKIWRASLFIFPIVYLLAPFPSLVASAPSSKDQTALTWVTMSSVLLLFVLGRTGVTPAVRILPKTIRLAYTNFAY
jgi:hypothetical protein